YASRARAWFAAYAGLNIHGGDYWSLQTTTLREGDFLPWLGRRFGHFRRVCRTLEFLQLFDQQRREWGGAEFQPRQDLGGERLGNLGQELDRRVHLAAGGQLFQELGRILGSHVLQHFRELPKVGALGAPVLKNPFAEFIQFRFRLAALRRLIKPGV